MSETPKRLAPKIDVLRQLFLLSGNECAFPGCQHRLIDEDGVWIAETCHIEAAEPDGERFNDEMTNEERRAVTNLLLMCHAHHKKTNNVDSYPVDRMRKIKRDHEKRFGAGIEALLDSVSDWTAGSSLHAPKKLAAFHEHLGHDDSTFTVEENEQNVEIVLRLAEDVRQLSKPARQLLAIVVQRGRPFGHRGGEMLGVLARELEDVTGMQPRLLRERVGQLEERRLAYIDAEEGWDFWGFAGPYVATRSRDYPAWADIRGYCEAASIDLHELIVDLRFDLLD